jgi:protein-S-isoprenylcysteine O-methyltransferase Ste14
MNATALGFRLRSWIFLVVLALGFTAPWELVLQLDGSGPNSHVWGQLAVLLSRGGALSISAAFNLVLVVGIVCAVAGAWMRTWGSAYLGVDVMSDAKMRADGVVADGPYAHLRNPLYVGAWLNTMALALLMPASGAIFTLVLMVAFQVHTILREEAFLRAKLGEPYVAYCAQVPRFLPKPRPQKRDLGHPIVGSGTRPRWGQAAVAEIFMWGSAVTFALLGWRYDAHLLIQGVLVSLGASLVVKGMAKPRT